MLLRDEINGFGREESRQDVGAVAGAGAGPGAPESCRTTELCRAGTGVNSTAEMAVTCYDVLAVDPEATDEEIETAFRRRARETHPDVSDHADATERFRLLARARTTLRDDEQRARYDRLGHDAYAEQAWSDEFAATWLTVTEEWGLDSDGDPARERSDPTVDDTPAGTTATDSESATEWHEGADAAGAEDRATGGTDPDEAGRADSATVSGGTGRTTADVGDAGLWDTGSSWVDADRNAGSGDDEGFGIRNVEPTAGGRRLSVSIPDESDLLFAVALFIGYPFFLYGSVAPAFPLAINVTLAGLTLLLVGAALVRPAVGIGVFGGWGVVAPAVILLWNVDVAAESVVVPAVVGACWLPFAFALLVASEYG